MVMFLKNIKEIEHKIPILNYFLLVRELTASFCIVYDYTISGHTDLYMYICTVCTVYVHFLYNLLIYFLCKIDQHVVYGS
jgi:hypothetical protein